MEFPPYFADAEASFSNADFIIFGVPFDKTSTFRQGTDKSPMKIRQASWNFETFNIKTGLDLRDIKFHDYGDLSVQSFDSNKMINHVRDFASKIIKNKKFPIAIGGEHSISSGLIQAFSKDIAVLSLDAHLDFREQYENNINNHACVIKRISDHIKIKNIAVIGYRSAEKEEFEDAEKLNLFKKDIFSIREKGFSKVLKQTKDYLKNRKIYLTLDMDVIDPAYAPGVTTPEPFGLTPSEVFVFIETFSSQLVGFDLVEVCPEYDFGETSLLAAKIIRFLIERVWFYKIKR